MLTMEVACFRIRGYKYSHHNYRCQRLQVLTLEVIDAFVGGYKCLCWRLQVFALEVASFKGCKYLSWRKSIFIFFCFHCKYRCSHWRKNIFVFFFLHCSYSQWSCWRKNILVFFVFIVAISAHVKGGTSSCLCYAFDGLLFFHTLISLLIVFIT